MKNRKKIFFYNILFIVVCAGLFLFLWNAPPTTTAYLPHDEDHERFMTMGKKAAEKFCTQCHGPEAKVPFPKDHPPKYRCLFCHKRTVEKTAEKH